VQFLRLLAMWSPGPRLVAFGIKMSHLNLGKYVAIGNGCFRNGTVQRYTYVNVVVYRRSLSHVYTAKVAIS